MTSERVSAAVSIRPLEDADRGWAADVIAGAWASERVASRGRLHHPARDLPGFVALFGVRRVGLATWFIEGDECELVTLNAIERGAGVGEALIGAVRARATDAGCSRLVVITTNDNAPAQRFYERHGFRLVAVCEGAIDEYRRSLKPEIGLNGVGGVRIADEMEYEMLLVPDDGDA